MPAVGKLGAGLERAWQAVQNAYKDAQAQGALSRIGEMFQQLAERPGYFVTSHELPKGYNDYEAAKMLARKHDILLNQRDMWGHTRGGGPG